MGFKEETNERLNAIENLNIKDRIKEAEKRIFYLQERINFYEYIFKELNIEIFTIDEFEVLKKMLSKNEINKFKDFSYVKLVPYGIYPDGKWYFRKIKKGKK